MGAEYSDGFELLSYHAVSDPSLKAKHRQKYGQRLSPIPRRHELVKTYSVGASVGEKELRVLLLQLRVQGSLCVCVCLVCYVLSWAV